MPDKWIIGLVLAIILLTPIFRRTQAIFLRKKWRPIDTTISRSYIAGSGEANAVFVIVRYIVDGQFYSATIDTNTMDEFNYRTGNPISLLVNPRKPGSCIIDVDYDGLLDRLANWLASNLIRLQQRG